MITKNLALGEIFLFLGFLVDSLRSAPFAPFFKLYLALNFLPVLAAPVVRALALGTSESDEIIL